ncbi:arylsulfatase [uncultured Chitinophaga sp.]|uniref:sulfatase family protein n=1 Tax=uncultured Chitinophaga sp. TaxID=339340 RepID=UPI0025F51426|nr:arylsulfatase [uncultured Chitinophaga sp.]
MKKLILGALFVVATITARAQQPNVIFICADDLGYGDVSSYGATRLKTPNIDKLAAKGVRFTNGHCTSATCTPSRYAIMTGQYPWRKNAQILPGDAALIIPTNKLTLPAVFRKAGYTTGVVGKWHLGLGSQTAKNWNAEVKPGPNEVGFDYSFIFPATADRVPTVFMENRHVLGLDDKDPIQVDYTKKVGNDPTGLEHPELLKMQASPNHGHNQTIVNGIGRIGYMTGGTKARWVDEEVSFTFLSKAQAFIRSNSKKPFFLYLAVTEPHVPRMPATIFRGKSGLGYRGDAILQLDWTVGEIMAQLESSGITNNTLIVFSSDNGPVVDDGYADEAVTLLNGHTPAGPLRGGKYSAFEGGTRVPFIVSWPGGIKPGVSDALVCQLDFIASFAKLLQVNVPAGEATDSEEQLDALLGKSRQGRKVLVQQGGAMSLVKDKWKYIEPSPGPAVLKLTNTESGSLGGAQLYNLQTDIGEQQNLAAKYPEKVMELKEALDKVRK